MSLQQKAVKELSKHFSYELIEFYKDKKKSIHFFLM